MCSWNPDVREQNKWSSANPIQKVAQMFGSSIMMRLCACMYTRCWWQMNITNLCHLNRRTHLPSMFSLVRKCTWIFQSKCQPSKTTSKAMLRNSPTTKQLFDQKRSWALKRLSTSVGLVCQCNMLARGPTQDANGISSYWDVLQQQSQVKFYTKTKAKAVGGHC